VSVRAQAENAAAAISKRISRIPPATRAVMRRLRYTTGAMKLKGFGTLVLAGLALVVCAPASWAHHSFAMFDVKKTVTLNGTVKEFQWISPHVWIVMTTPVPGGQPKQWAIELSSPRTLARMGFTPKTFTPGMNISIEMHPLKDGSPGGTGNGLNVKFPDGKVMKMD
jgi:hypothetical protein